MLSKQYIFTLNVTINVLQLVSIIAIVKIILQREIMGGVTDVARMESKPSLGIFLTSGTCTSEK